MYLSRNAYTDNYYFYVRISTFSKKGGVDEVARMAKKQASSLFPDKVALCEAEQKKGAKFSCLLFTDKEVKSLRPFIVKMKKQKDPS